MSESISLKFNHSEDHLLENESYFFCSSPSLLNSMFNELIPSATESKTYVEDFKGDKREILFSDFSYIIKNEFHQINRVFVEKVLAGISKKYEFRLPHTKTLNTNTKFKIVKPLEVEYPLINKHYLSIKGSEKIIKMGTFYNNLFKKEDIHEFGFIGTSEESCPYVINTLIPLALFFVYHENLTVNLILNRENIKRVCLHFGESKSDSIEFSGSTIPVSSIEKINLIDIDDLTNLAKQIRRKNIFQNFYEKANQVTLWQVPSVNAMENKKQQYFPLLEVIENLSLVSLRGREKKNCISKAISYFSNINIKILGNVWAVKKL